MAPRAADSDGGSCPDLNSGLGGGLDDTSSVLHSAGRHGSSGVGVGGAGVGLLSLMQSFTKSVKAKVHDALQEVVQEFSNTRGSLQDGGDLEDLENAVGGWLDGDTCDAIGEFLTDPDEPVDAPAWQQYLDAGSNVVQRGLEAAVAAGGMQASLQQLADGVGHAAAAAYCAGQEVDPEMAAALQQLSSEGGVAAAYCCGKLYTGVGALPGAGEVILGSAVPQEKWAELQVDSTKMREEAQNLAARHGTRKAGAPVAPTLRAGQLNVIRAAVASERLATVYAAGAKLRAARQLDG